MIRPHDSIVVQLIARILVPFIQVFALYVFFHGHYSPGGGFQAGVLIAASFILKMLVGTTAERKSFSIRREFLIAAAGVGIYLAIGLIAVCAGSMFLDYGALEILNQEPAFRRYWGILIAEAGVFAVVAMTLVVIFNVLAISESTEAIEK